MTTGERIIEFRKERGMLQIELAEKVGCSSQVISNIERSVSRVTTDMAVRIADVLRVPAEEIMKDEPQEAVYLSEEENQIVLNYRKLLPDECEIIKNMIRALLMKH